MKKINFNVPVTNLDGKPMMDGKDQVKVSRLVANMLCAAKADKDAIRQLDMALKIYNSTDVLELDDEDVEIVKKTVRQSQATALVAGQILKLLA
jgi:hypothetical protein